MTRRWLTTCLAAASVVLGLVTAASPASAAQVISVPMHLNYSQQYARVSVGYYAPAGSTTAIEVLGTAAGSEGQVIASGTSGPAEGDPQIRWIDIHVDTSRIGATVQVRATTTLDGFEPKVWTHQIDTPPYDPPIELAPQAYWGGYTISGMDGLIAFGTTVYPSHAKLEVTLVDGCTNRVLGTKVGWQGYWEKPDSPIRVASFDGPASRLSPVLIFRTVTSAPEHETSRREVVVRGWMGGPRTCSATPAPKTQPNAWVKSWGKKSGKAKVGKTVKVAGARLSPAATKAGARIRYTWYLNGRQVNGATKARLKVAKTVTTVKNGKTRREATKGKTLQLEVRSSAKGYKDGWKRHSFGRVKK